MKPKPKPHVTFRAACQATDKLWIQAPLPNCLNTLPILVTIEGRGSGRQGPSPLAPPEEPANDKL